MTEAKILLNINTHGCGSTMEMKTIVQVPSSFTAGRD